MTEPLRLVLLALALALATAQPPEAAPSPQEAPAASRFTWIDLWIDTGTEPLAAWQIELRAADAATSIVGIEGGEPAVFREPARYDPRALRRRRVILATWTTAPLERLPRGRTRVARVHLETRNPEPPEFTLRLIAAAREDGREIAATTTLSWGR